MAEKPENTSKKLFKGAVLLTAASIFIKILSAGYRVPYQNIAGDIGFYIYQQVYPFYGIAIAFSTYGFPMAVSKLIAERHSSKFTVREIILDSLIILSVIGILIFWALYFGAAIIADRMRDPGLAQLIRIIAFSFLLMPLISVIRGYYQGVYDMVPTAASQVSEQLVRVSAILGFSFVLIGQGYSLYEAGAGAVLGSVAGGITSALVLVSFMWARKDWKRMSQSEFRTGNFPIITKTLLIHGVAFCITSLILVLIQLVDSMHLYMLLRQSGLTEMGAKEWKGIYDRGQPLIQLGTVVSNSISLSLVPLMSGYLKKNLRNEMDHIIKMALLISLTIGAAAAVGLICIIEPANYMLFTDGKGSAELAVLSISIIFTSVIMAQASILQSLGHTSAVILIVSAGIAAKWFLNYLFVPGYQIMGASLATVISFFLMSLLFFTVLQKHVNQPLFEKRQIYILLIASFLMGFFLWVYNGIFQAIIAKAVFNRILATIQALTGVVLGGFLFILVIVRKGMFTSSELNMVPFGSKLAKLLPKKKL